MNVISRGACAINAGQTVIVTGGGYSSTRVSEYSETGYIKDYPDLLQGRYNHACTYYTNEQGTKVYSYMMMYNNFSTTMMTMMISISFLSSF